MAITTYSVSSILMKHANGTWIDDVRVIRTQEPSPDPLGQSGPIVLIELSGCVTRDTTLNLPIPKDAIVLIKNWFGLDRTDDEDYTLKIARRIRIIIPEINEASFVYSECNVYPGNYEGRPAFKNFDHGKILAYFGVERNDDEDDPEWDGEFQTLGAQW